MTDKPLWQAVLLVLRRLSRATDLQSKRLERHCGLTIGQLMVLRAIAELGDVTLGRLSSEVSLSQATVTTILNRLEARGLLERLRSAADKRVVNARLTVVGRSTLAGAPLLLHERFIERYEALQPWEQTQILSSLQRVAAMMDAQELDEAKEAGAAEGDGPS